MRKLEQEIKLLKQKIELMEKVIELSGKIEELEDRGLRYIPYYYPLYQDAQSDPSPTISWHPDKITDASHNRQ